MDGGEEYRVRGEDEDVQFPKVWGETRLANKIGMVGELAGRTHRINTGGDERYMSLYLRRVSHSGLDWPSKLTLDEFLLSTPLSWIS